MKLLSISTRNFRLHAHSDVTFPPEGVTGIIGTNEAGKSTLLEAAVWALYGGDTTRGTKAGLRWFRAAPRKMASATLRFEVGGQEYTVERTESGARLTGDDGTVIADGLKPVNEYIPQLIGMSHAEFSASFLCKQKDLARIASMLPTERQAFIRSVMGVGKIDAALKTCRKRKAALAEERRGLEAGLGEREPLVDALETAHGEESRASVTLSARRDDLTDAKDVAATVEENLAASTARRRERDDIERRRLAVVAVVDQCDSIVRGTQLRLHEQHEARERLVAGEAKVAPLDALREEGTRLTEAEAVTERRQFLEREVSRLTWALDGPSGLRERHQDAAAQAGFFDVAAYARASDAVTAAVNRMRDLTAARAKAQAEASAQAQAHEKAAALHERRAAAIREAGDAGGCPTCLRALGEQFERVLATLDEQAAQEREARALCSFRMRSLADPSDDEIEAGLEMEEARAEMERQRVTRQDAQLGARQAEVLDAEITQAAAGLERVRTALAGWKPVAPDPVRLAEVRRQIKEIEAVLPEVVADRRLAAQVPATEADLSRAVAAALDARQTAADLQAALDAVPFDAARDAALIEAATQARERLSEANVAFARADEALSSATRTVASAQAALDAYDARAGRLTELLADHMRHERADARLSEFRVAVATTIRPEMEELMSGFVQILTDGRHESVTLTEGFEAILHESGTPVEVVSGGTEDIAALAMRLAISQMIAARAGQPLSLLILDEPFGSLDETRRGNVLALIRRLGSVFRQVVVISHVAETRDAVDHVVELEFDEAAGMTRVLCADAHHTTRTQEGYAA